MVIAAAAATVQVGTGLAGTGPPPGPAGVLGLAALAAGGLALLFARPWPVPTLVAVGLCGLAHQGAGLDVPLVAFLVAVYYAVRAGNRAVTALVAAGMIVALPLVVLGRAGDLGNAVAQSRDALELAWLVAAAAAGEAIRQAERRAAEAERTREETARRRADDERLRIARELHDSLTHQISIITVQADVAVHGARRRGEPVAASLLAVQEAGREASRELRATLSALRDDATAPPRGLAQLPDLVAGAGAMGLDASLAITGDVGDLPEAVGRTLFRVVQEALTNVARHAGDVTVRVMVEHEPDRVSVRVDDDGPATTGDIAPGNGLVGMRERVHALGGRFCAGPRTGGGYTVRACIPVQEPR
ncbi:histidine kinase [Isoptericola sp. NEAU-Y5]|uniref:histidine kinase n=1 Tax=Isoptericola luteus TaxID=2879484 RepID=A0ABS7ZA47_9MICO|nr:histidine kinase [Isoptericola sp. NEAU-Y5]MCA5891929.1 histidine kinase [Isoptericola sp. NEAU-Y5]